MNIPQLKPYIGMEEYESIKECFDTNWLTEGPKSKKFVEELCKIIGVEYGVLTPNGTLALYLGLKSLGIGHGDEVIVPNFTFIASATAVVMAGAIPIFADINKETLQIDIEDCKRVLTKDTKAIMPVHIYGASCDMDLVSSFAKEHNLLVIEDAAQAMGVTWKSKHCGGLSDVGCFSFFADKTISTIEGGFVGTNSEQTYRKLLYLRNQGRINRGSFIHPEIGYNFRLNDLQASIGLVQLQKKDVIYSRKLENYNCYLSNLAGVENIKIITAPQNSGFMPFRTSILFDKNQEDVAEYLSSRGIETRTFFYPLNKQPCFKHLNQKLSDQCFKNSVYVSRHGLCFPVYPELTTAEIDYICDRIKEVVK